MKQVMNYNKDNGLLNMIRRTDPMIIRPRSVLNPKGGGKVGNVISIYLRK